MVDNLKWLFAVAVIIAALWGFYAYADQSLLLRAVVLLAALGVAAAAALQTEKGRVAWAFGRDARTEVRKVVWPSRKETVQTTGLILAMVAVVAVFLWILDTFLGWLTRTLLGS